jgi:serine/threonine-protein kinase
LRLICDRDYPWPSQVRLGYPRELEAVVMRALAKDRADRWQSAREMQGALEEFVRRERLGVSTIALSQFMQGLFEEKLASQREALLQGKQLADIIALETPAESVANLPQTGATTTNPAMHTLGNLGPARQKWGGLAAAAAGLATALASSGGVWWATHRMGPAQPAAQAAAGLLAITTDPPGASITLDGERRAETTPATIRIAIGTPVRVTLSKDGFEDATRTVSLTDREPSGAMTFALKRGTLTIDVGLNPPVQSTTLLLDSKPYASTTIENVSAGESHKLVVQAPGYAPESLSFVGGANERRHFEITLARAEGSRPADRVAHVAAGAAALPLPLSPAPAPPTTATGKLNVSAKGGWCNVTIDGTPRGPTPIAGIVLPAGAHAVTCTPEGGRALSQSVRIEADATARFAFTLPPQ